MKKKVSSMPMKKKKLAAKKNIRVATSKQTVSSHRPVNHKPTGIDKPLHVIVTVIFAVIRYSIVFVLGGLATLVTIILVVTGTYVQHIASTSSISVEKLLQIATDGHSQAMQKNQTRESILILGTDALANRDTRSQLTDTIMVVSINPSSGNVDTFSLPRDLWIASHSAKINALYERNSDLTKQVVEDITNLQIDDQIVIDIATVGKLIDAFGGLDVNVQRSFVDYRFPRSDVDVRIEHDPSKLYETIAFTQGIEHMSGDRALRYIRSRHSFDVVEGTDDARVRRQQQVIQAIIAKFKDPLLLRNPEQIGALLHIYTSEMKSTLSLEKGSAIGWTIIMHRKTPQLITHQFANREVDVKGVFTHPDKFPGGTWVYLPVDSTYAQLKNLVHGWIAE